MSFDEAAPKLPSFGIRELYDSEVGILHISEPQYDSTIRSYPEAVLSYVDDDDGEVITVGSGLELQQRLDEPVRLHRRSRHGVQASSSRRGSMDDSMIHLFDIQRTQDNLAVWREHEAYSSKILRSSRSSSAVSEMDPDDTLPLQRPDTSESVSPLPEPQSALIEAEPVVQDEAAPALGVDKQCQSATESTSRQTTSNDFMQDLNDVLSAACKGLESFGLADILDGTAKALQSIAQKTRDADTSPVEGLLEGIKDMVTEFGKFGLEVMQNLDNAPVTVAKEPETTHAQAAESASCNNGRKADAKMMRQQDKLVRKEARLAVKEQRKEEKRARRVERLSHREERRAGKRGAAPDTTESEQPEDFSHDAPASFPDQAQSAPAQQPRKRVSFADLQERIREEFLGPKQPGAGMTPSSDPPTNFPTTPAEHVEGLTFKATIPASTLSAPFGEYQSWPRRARPSLPKLTQSNKALDGSASIMDLETSNPEFTARYPPLMSLRRAKTVSELYKRSHPATADNSATTTKAALTRYPSIGQLEAWRRVEEDPTQTQVIAMQADMLRRREKQKAETSAHAYRAPSIEEDNDALPSPTPFFRNLGTKESSGSAAKPLPGAWPETRQDEGSTVESSGAFFNRMAGIKESKPAPPRAVSPALSCRTTSPPEDPYFPPPGLRRAQTVTASNPAARLTRPFDPLSNAPRLEPARPHHPHGPTPQRSFSVQHSRRTEPGSALPTVSGPPTLWSNFPRSAQVPILRAQPSTAPQNRPPHFQRPIWPNNSNTSAAVSPPNRFPRPMRSDPNFQYPAPTPTRGGRNGLLPPPPPSTSKVDECVRTLRAMGYGMNDPHEAARLHVYAGASAGDVQEAIDMIEEDREAAEAIKDGTANIRVL